jgi:pSer/pThr/pTyr-binding forkhead associated (FHA) protein
MTARLVALEGTAEIALAGRLTIVGRHHGCDVCLDSSRVSRRHCCLALGDDAVLVRDLGSTNGIRINGRRVVEGLLRPGDVLSIAHLQFRLAGRDPDGAERSSDTICGPAPSPAAPAREPVAEIKIQVRGPTEETDFHPDETREA